MNRKMTSIALVVGASFALAGCVAEPPVPGPAPQMAQTAALLNDQAQRVVTDTFGVNNRHQIGVVEEDRPRLRKVHPHVSSHPPRRTVVAGRTHPTGHCLLPCEGDGASRRLGEHRVRVDEASLVATRRATDRLPARAGSRGQLPDLRPGRVPTEHDEAGHSDDARAGLLSRQQPGTADKCMCPVLSLVHREARLSELRLTQPRACARPAAR